MTAALVLTALASPGFERDFDIALGQAGLSTATARWDDGILGFYRQSDKPTALYGPCYQDPWRTPFYLEMLRKQAMTSSGRPASVFEIASRSIGQGTRRSLLGDPASVYADRSKAADSLGDVLRRMKEAGLIKGAVPSLAKVPDTVKKSAAALLEAGTAMVAYRRAAFAGVPDLPAAYASVRGDGLEPSGPLEERRQLTLRDQCAMSYLYAAAQDLGATVNWAEGQLRLVPATLAYDVRIDTDWGKIVLTGGSASVHDGEATLLLIDTGGDDTYVNVPANASAANWLSVVVDTTGKDKYLSDPALAKSTVADWPQRGKSRRQNGPGSALFGLTFLVDLEGDDLYRSARPSFGSGTFGAAYVGDRAGDDTYDSYADSEGFGLQGIGVLDDSKGKDTYRGFTQVQGAGLPGGFGAVIDADGDDTYDANDTVLDFPSAQTSDHNNSMAQGAGYGFRADYLTGRSQSGGIGLLYDMAGNDRYACGVFGQACGYWEGTGILWDDAGNDTYGGQWYVQGAAAHFGIGYLEDSDGTDSYTAGMNMAQGAGHDFSLGMLIDRAGDDRYQAPNLSLGAGNANGIGAFLDLGGSDTYASVGITLGTSAEAQKSSMRERALSLGAFLDLGGTDTYPEGSTWARNGNRTVNWNQKNDKPSESQVGVFLDR